MQPNPEHAQAFPGSEHTLRLLDVTVIDDLIHRYSVKLPLAGTARWIGTAQLGVASSRAGHLAGSGAGMLRDAARRASWASLAVGQGCSGMLPAEPAAFYRAQGAASFVLVVSKMVYLVKETPRDDTTRPDRCFSTLRGMSLRFN